jgi:hypothetical protein
MSERIGNSKYMPPDEACNLTKKYKAEQNNWKHYQVLNMSMSDAAHIFVLVVLIGLGAVTYYVFRKG